MTPTAFRPVLFAGLALAVSACSGVEGDANRFERWGEAVARIPVSSTASATPSAAERGLRPALQIQVMDPHELWAARDGELAPVIAAAAPAMARAAAPAVVEAVRAGIAEHTGAAERAGLRTGVTIQIGAYSSEQAAMTAWRTAAGRAPAQFGQLEPTLEPVTVSGRQLVRLKAGPVPAADAPAVCRAAGVTDQWCASTARS